MNHLNRLNAYAKMNDFICMKNPHIKWNHLCRAVGLIRLDETELSKPCRADLQVVLSVQCPGGERPLRGARYAPQTLGVEGQAHDRLGVGFGQTQPGPLGHVPQQQGTVLVSSQQERPGTRVWLKGRGVRGEKTERSVRKMRVLRSKETHRNQRTVQRLSSWKLPLTLRDAAGSIHQPAALSLQNAITTLLTLLLIHITAPQASPPALRHVGRKPTAKRPHLLKKSWFGCFISFLMCEFLLWLNKF